MQGPAWSTYMTYQFSAAMFLAAREDCLLLTPDDCRIPDLLLAQRGRLIPGAIDPDHAHH
jgi:hypothetical protein